MKWRRMKRTLAILSSVALMGSFTAFSAAAEEPEVYTPNRAFVIENESASTVSLSLTAMPNQLGAEDEPNGPYHLWARMNIDGLEAIDDSQAASISVSAKYGYYPAGGDKMQYRTEELCSWTADTDGWVDMTLPDGHHLTLESLDPLQNDEENCDVTVEITVSNAKGTFQIADLVIADKTDEIVYSLANDPCFSGITDFSRKQSTELNFLWSPAISGGDATIGVETAKVKPDYVPNYVLTLDIPANQEGEAMHPEDHAYIYLNLNAPPTTVFTTEGNPYTLRGMVKVENFARETSEHDDNAITRSQNPAFMMGNSAGSYWHGLTGNTDGWIPLLKGDGTPFTFNYDSSTSWYRFWGSWGCTGQYSLADLEVLDKDGNVVYSFETDTDLTDGAVFNAAHKEPTNTGGKSGLLLWSDGFDSAYSYRYDVADEITEHTEEDYAIPVFEETYVPYEEEGGDEPTTPPTTAPTAGPATTTTTTTGSATPTPDTGVALPLAAIPLAALGLAAVLATRRRRQR